MKYILISILVLIMGNGTPAAASDMSLRITVAIQLEKDSYAVGESLKGEVTIKNTYPRSVPSIFVMRMTHNSEVATKSQMAVEQLFTGTNTFSLRSFHILQRPFTEDDLGTWIITINKLNRAPEYAAQAVFEVLPQVNSPENLKQ